MRLRMLGGLALEGSDFARPVPLLLLAYLTLAGPKPRSEVAHTLFFGATDELDSLSIALRRLKGAGGDEELVRVAGADLHACVDADALALARAHEAGELERTCELYTGPLLAGLERHRSVRPENWSYGLAAWLHDERLRVARAVLGAAVRLARARLAADDEPTARRHTDLALAVFADEHHAFDERQPGRLRFDPADLRLLHALACRTREDALPAFRERAADYPGLTLPDDCAAAVAGELRSRRIQLEPPRTPFFGRADERARVAELLAARPRGFVTLVGRGGVGKTSLAVRVALDLHETGRYPDGAAFVALEDLRFANLVPVRLAQTLDLPLHTRGDALDQVVAHLADRRLLLVLDNYDHLLERSDVPARLVAGCPGVGVLVTSRERLGTAGERTLPLEGLGVGDDPDGPAAADGGEAMALFLHGARRRRADFALDERTAPLVRRICRLSDGHPLSIDLAAGLVDIVPLEELAERMHRDLALLATDAPDVPRRHRSLRSLWDSSWEGLDEQDRGLLRRLAVFDGGFDWAAARDVARAGASALRRLVDKSLLRASDAQRFGFHASLRAFVQEKLADDPEREDLQARHRAHYLERAREQAARMRGRDAATAVAFFEREAANLRAAWEGAREVSELLAFVDALDAFQNHQGYLDERLELLRRALDAAAEAGRDPDAAMLWNAQASIHLQRGDLERARQALATALELQPDDAEDAVRAESLSQLGGVHYQRRELDPALACFERARQIRERLGDTAQAIGELSNVGAVHYQRGDHQAAIRIWREALTGQRRAHDLETQALLLANLGAAYQAVGRLEEALLHHEKAKALLDTIGDRAGSAAAEISIGGIHFLRGAFDASTEANLRALDAYRRRSDPVGEALVLNNLAMIHERTGRLAVAYDLLGEALALQEHDDDRVYRAATLHNLSTVALQLGRVERAEALARESLDLADETEQPTAQGYARTFLADALAARGDAAGADAAYAEALRLFEATGDRIGQADAAARQAEHALARGDRGRAGDLAERALRTAEELGLRPLASRARRVAERAREQAGGGG